ncbi:tetracycline resistance MFS efflux pump [Alicyclobacillus hesperidum subsp. aegles]|uniref:MFS transporter n=1 Tax=Alicyclobacillus hesperidum TaxID=89784 RepID=UPI0022298890|nr:MFS transporter [Alicyclobacillus hesperidum]GLG01365.1 tetracycline resistance MFS efflux pump [Alicyclobacillus hesperidum subsp. aegles]
MTVNRLHAVRYLQTARALRSVSQGVAIVDMTLYLRDLHWSATEIGGVMSAAGVCGAALILLVGVLSDRIGRKPFLLTYECMTACAALVVGLCRNPYVLALAVILTGFGRGQNGAAGPFTPAEQAWLASAVSRERRSRVFSINTALGFFGMALGAVLGGLPRLWIHSLPGAAAYRPLFYGLCVISLGCAIVIWRAPGGKAPERVDTKGRPDVEPVDAKGAAQFAERTIRRQENRNMAKLAFVNLLNGLGVGFVGPMMTYWFAARFGANSAQIGATLAVSFVVTGLAAVLSGVLAERFGMVRSVVWLRLVGVALMLILPFMPTFSLASVVYAVRSALSRGTQGARSALGSSLTRDQRRGFSLSMNSFFTRLASAIGPSLSGTLLDSGSFALPFVFAGGLQLVSSLLYGYMFRQFDTARSQKSA